MPAPTGRPWRHRRVWLLASAPRAAVWAASPEAVDVVLAWAAQGRALVGRGRQPADPPGRLGLGLAQRVDGQKLRWAVSVTPQAVARVDEPLTLAEALPSLPAAMQPTARQLVDAASALGLPLRVYGSAFWQHTGGGPCLHDASDLDLLAQPTTAAQATRWLAALARLQADSPLRLDGEIELPGGAAVAWRELAGEGPQLLVKSDAGPRLCTRAAVWRAWASPGVRA